MVNFLVSFIINIIKYIICLWDKKTLAEPQETSNEQYLLDSILEICWNKIIYQIILKNRKVERDTDLINL